jgi:putative transposase
MNRGVRRSQLFFRPADYEAFLGIMCAARARVPMRVLAFVLMPNHWHMVLWPVGDADLTKFVGWTSLTHAARWQRFHGKRGLGHVYQGRFRALPVEPGEHLLTVLRYVERNPVRSRLVERAEAWPFSSASDTLLPHRPALHPWPVPRPPTWLDLVNEPERDVALDALRQCVARNAPFGTAPWRQDTVTKLGWTSGTRPAGKPLALAQALRE